MAVAFFLRCALGVELYFIHRALVQFHFQRPTVRIRGIYIQRISVKPTAALVGAGGRRRARELFRGGQGGGFHSGKDPRNGLKIF